MKKKLKSRVKKKLVKKPSKRVPRKNLAPHEHDDQDHDYESEIVIDAENGLVFHSEEELFQHFKKTTDILESEFKKLRTDQDIAVEDFLPYEDVLPDILSDPDEIWEDTSSSKEFPIIIYIKQYEKEKEKFWYVALVYVADDLPSFIFLHFPTQQKELVDKYRRDRCYYDKNGSYDVVGGIEGDALAEGEELAVGLYQSMLKVRADSDIPVDEFSKYSDLRDQSIEDADEIWRHVEMGDTILVHFIKDFSDVDKELWYVVVTVEDTDSESHYLLFSFPTNDKSLVDRYRHGENLQAEEVVRADSH